MRLAEFYERAINWPTRTGIALALVVATLLVVAGLVLPLKRRIWLGRCLGLLGLCIFMTALFTLREQVISEKPSDGVTVKRFRHSERTRGWVLFTMIGVPCAAVAVMWFGYVKVRYKQQREVPRHLKAGRSYLAQKDYESALGEYDQAIQSAPQLAEGYCGRGIALQAMGKFEQALADFDRALEHDPRHAAARLERGKSKFDSGDFDAALADFGEIMLIKANDPESYLHRGMCLAKKGLFDEAQADFHRVLKLTNHTDFAEPATNYLAQLQDQAGRAQFPGGNGASPGPSSPKARAQDHAI